MKFATSQDHANFFVDFLAFGVTQGFTSNSHCRRSNLTKIMVQALGAAPNMQGLVGISPWPTSNS